MGINTYKMVSGLQFYLIDAIAGPGGLLWA